MAIYGMKDAANLVVVEKSTQKPVLFIDYANATSSEWTSDAVYATKKGVNAIRWDNARTGTLTLDSELFDFNLLAMVIGSDVAEGKTDVMSREVATIGATKEYELETDGVIDPKTLSVIKLKQDLVEHDGYPLASTDGLDELLPGQVEDVVVSVNDTEADVTFTVVPGATSYIVKRDNVVVGEVTTNAFSETSLSAETTYAYTVVANNGYGQGPASAVVEAETAAAGTSTKTPHQATPQALIDAGANIGTPNSENGIVTFTYENGKIVFNDEAKEGDSYAIFFLEEVDNARTITIHSEKYPGNYEIFADATIREQETGDDDIVQIHYKNAKPQSNFTLTQSASEPTNLSIVFDLLPDKDKHLAEIKMIK